MVTFERRKWADNLVLPEWAWGACGWMVAKASNKTEARSCLVRDLEQLSLVFIELDDEHEVFGVADLAELDEHLAANFVMLEAGKQTLWGTLHCYKGEGEA